MNGSFTANLALGNRDVTFTILAEYEFSSANAAFMFVMRLGLDCPGFGSLELGTFGKGGARVYYPSAVIRSVKPYDINEASFKLQYEIAAGAPG